MRRIATLTLNPSIDVAYEFAELRPTVKIRCSEERYAPGGGGLNVARVLARFGHRASCYYLSGGRTGATLDRLLLHAGLERRPLPITGDTRVCFNSLETGTGLEYRFVPKGPEVSAAEWQTCLHAVETTRCDYLVASGSLPRGVPVDFYARLAALARARGFRLVLDTSGEALRAGLAEGGVYLVKPSETEIAALAGEEIADLDAYAAAAEAVVADGQAELVALTLGPRGGILASSDGTEFVPVPQVEARSAVGAGDSTVAGMVHRLATGAEPLAAFRFGLAAGTAAVLTPGTDMCRPEDVERIYREMGGS